MSGLRTHRVELQGTSCSGQVKGKAVRAEVKALKRWSVKTKEDKKLLEGAFGTDGSRPTCIDFSISKWDFSFMKQQLVSRNPEVLGGTPVFAGTRVPLQ